MWSEEWDDRIREAAGEPEGPVDANSGWQQMQPLLEKYLPADNRRKRFFLLLFLLIGAGVAVYLNTFSSQKNHNPEKALTGTNKIENSTKTDRKNQSTSTANSQAETNKAPDAIAKTESMVKAGPAFSESGKPGRVLQKTSTSNIPAIAAKPAKNSRPEKPYRNKSGTTEQEEPVLPYIPEGKPQPGLENTVTGEHLPPHAPNLSADSIHQETFDEQVHDPTESPENRSAEKNPRWALSLAAGADISATAANNPGQWRPAMGLLLQYRLAPKLWIRTGFLATRKVYSAGPDDYDPPKIFWNYVSELKHVEANCLVYEIPVWLQYRFGKDGNSLWSASAGLSSILMKKESYDYEVRDLVGQDRYMSRSYNNYSNHLFSTLHLSAGYRLPLSKNWSLGAEPYLKIPLSGIGYGNVKLYSVGIMLSATISK